MLEEPPSGKSLDVSDSVFDSLLAGIDLGEIASLAAGGLLPSEIDSVISAHSTSVFDHPYNLTVPTSDHAEIHVALLYDLLLDLDVASKSSIRNRDDLLTSFRYRSPATSSRSSAQLPNFTAARVPSKAGDVITVHLYHVLVGSIGKSICDGKIDLLGVQAGVVDVLHGSTSCSIRSHTTNEKSLVDTTLYI